MTRDESQGAVAVQARADAQSVDSVVEGWARLFTYLVIAIVVAATVIMPFAGLVAAFGVASYLRAGDVHVRRHRPSLPRLLAGPLTAPLDLVRGAVVTVVTVPYAAVFAVAVPLLIMSVAAVGVEFHPLVGAAWGAGAASYVLLAAPGIRAPRRHLVRVFTALAHEPRRIAAIGTPLCVLATVALAGAIALRPSFSPMYELKNSISQELSRFQDSLQQRVS